jgi:hypothetical protein
MTFRSCLKKATKPIIVYECKTKKAAARGTRKFFTIEGNKIKEIEVYFGSAPKEPG